MAREAQRRRRRDRFPEGENVVFEFDPAIDAYLEDNGDYEETMPENLNIRSDGGDGLKKIRFLYSSDGYNEEEPETFLRSDYETN